MGAIGLEGMLLKRIAEDSYRCVVRYVERFYRLCSLRSMGLPSCPEVTIQLRRLEIEEPQASRTSRMREARTRVV